MQLTLSLKVGYAEVNCAIQQMHRSHSAYSQRTPLYPNNLLVRLLISVKQLNHRESDQVSPPLLLFNANISLFYASVNRHRGVKPHIKCPHRTPRHSQWTPKKTARDTHLISKNCISPQTNCIEKSRLCVKNRGYLLVLLIPWFIILAMLKISNLSTFSRQQCVMLRVHFPSVKSQHGMNEEECSPRALIETQPRFESQGTRCQIPRVAARRRHWARSSWYWWNLQFSLEYQSVAPPVDVSRHIYYNHRDDCLFAFCVCQPSQAEDMNKKALEEYCNTG